MLTATIQYPLRSVSEGERDVVEKLSRSFYVDDLLSGADTIHEAEILYDTAKSKMAEAGMPL